MTISAPDPDPNSYYFLQVSKICQKKFQYFQQFKCFTTYFTTFFPEAFNKSGYYPDPDLAGSVINWWIWIRTRKKNLRILNTDGHVHCTVYISALPNTRFQCGVSSLDEGKVIGGQQVHPGEMPWQVPHSCSLCTVSL